MKWDTVQQFLRIGLYMGGSAWFGSEIADGEMFKAAIGGVLSVGAFLWWAVWERTRA